MREKLVVMGVAGCGKSSLAKAVANVLGWTLVEGDEFHPQSNIEKMRRGEPLTDDDRAGWLRTLAQQLQAHEQAVMTCSALRRRYRDLLRGSTPELRFIHLTLTPAQARERVALRCSHYFTPELVDSQFQTLESTDAEQDVLSLDATQSPVELLKAVTVWLQKEHA